MKTIRQVIFFVVLVTLFLALPMMGRAQFTYVTNNGSITITGYTDTNPVVVIPGVINGLPVTDIGTYAFSINLGITSVTIPEGVTDIELGAFYYCSGLTNVTLPDSLTVIGEQEFDF